MAIIACPDCQKEISSRAPACPHCGCPANAAATDPASPPTVRVQTEEVNRGFAKGIDRGLEGLGSLLIKAAVGLAILIFLLIMGSRR